MRSIDCGNADHIDPQHENSISGHTGSHSNDRFHIVPDMTIPGHNQFSQGVRSGWVRTRDWQGVVVALSLSHVRMGSEDGAWTRHHCRCIVVVACGGREGVVGMQTRAAGMGMSVGQQEHTHTCTCISKPAFG